MISRMTPTLRLLELSLGLDVESTWARPLNNPLEQDSWFSRYVHNPWPEGRARLRLVGAHALRHAVICVVSPSRLHPPENVSIGVRIPAL